MAKRLACVLSIGMAAACIGVGCHTNENPTPRVPVPAPQNRDAARQTLPERPLPAGATPAPAPAEADARAYADQAIVKQQLPGEARFVEAYRRVGGPRMVLFVNRTLEGQLVPVTENEALVDVERARKANTYLKPGEYDETWARSLDYQAVENVMMDWLACNGQTRVVSPTMARGKLTDQQIKDLQTGRPKVMAEVARELDADVLVQVQAKPTRQTSQGLEVRLVCEAISLKGGESIGRAVVDMHPPLEMAAIDRYTRYLVSKLMDDMGQTWMAGGGAPPAPAREGDGASAPSAPSARPHAPEVAPVEPQPVPPREPAPAPREVVPSEPATPPTLPPLPPLPSTQPAQP